MNKEKFPSNNLIYNRYDVIYGNDYFTIEYEGYTVDCHIVNDIEADINVWGKWYPQGILEIIIEKIFFKYPKLDYINVNKMYSDYGEFLISTNDIYIELPSSFEDILDRLSPKHKNTIRRKCNLITKNYGKIVVKYYKENIPNECVEKFFEWKRATHHRDYNTSTYEYLDTYHVTDAVALYANEEIMSIAFAACNDEVAYLENLSYNQKYEKFSPGFLAYEEMIKKLIERKIKKFYLGGGDYQYKRYFDAIDNEAFSGRIYSKKFWNKVNTYFNNNHIKNIVVYGLGKYGQSFLAQSKKLNINICYAVDRQIEKQEGIEVVKPSEINFVNDIDAIIITLKNKDVELHESMKKLFKKVIWWTEISDEILL